MENWNSGEWFGQGVWGPVSMGAAGELVFGGGLGRGEDRSGPTWDTPVPEVAVCVEALRGAEKMPGRRKGQSCYRRRGATRSK